MAKRKRRKPESVTDPFFITRVRIDGEPFTVYACRGCMRAWKLPEPVENWRIKSLLNHATTHSVDETIAAALDRMNPDPIPKVRRKKRVKAEQSKISD